MSARVFLIITVTVFFLLLTGCSGSGVTPPIEEPGTVAETTTLEKQSDSQHSLWGFWTIHFDPASLKLEIELLRNLEFHIDIIDMILPPACDNCLEVIFNSFDSDTGILVFCIILRNPFPVTGHDVRGIIFTDDAGHLLTNADDWTGLHDIPGGSGINPFKGFYGLYGESEFGPGDTRFETYEVYIPDPPHFTEFKFAVDASYPGQCKEPYAITDFTQEPLYDGTGQTAIAEVIVSDWQDDVCKVSLVAPEITGQPFALFYPHEDIWRVDLTNNTGAPAGEYEARIIANSTNSDDVVLHDYVTIEITEAAPPIPLYIDPSSGSNGENLVDVKLQGANFSGPDSEVSLTCESGPDINAINVVMIDPITIRCDFSIPDGAWDGLYDVEITNSFGKTGINDDMFLVYCPEPYIASADPNTHAPDDSQFTLTIYGVEFIDGPDLAIKLCEGGQPDIDATNVVLADGGTLTCDIAIPLGTPEAYWDIEMTNGCGTVTEKIDVFRIHDPLSWNEPLISLEPGYTTKVRDASTPEYSSYQGSTEFVIQGDLCTKATGTPVYQYYISTSDTSQAGDTWHQFDFCGLDWFTIQWTDYSTIAPSEVWLWVRCVDDIESTEPYLFATPLQLSHQVWQYESGFNINWTHWGLTPDAWMLNGLARIMDDPSEDVTGDGGIRRNEATTLYTGQNYTLESCSGYGWSSYTGCYIEPQIGETGSLGTAVGPQFTHRSSYEPLSASFTVPVTAFYYIGFYVVDASTDGNFIFELDNICLYHDP